MKDFFISYATADSAWAEWIAWQLESEGISTVLQAWDFLPGENFVLEMQKASTGTNRTLMVLSRTYLERFFTQSEWAAAFAADPVGDLRRLVPVRIDACQPPGLLAALIHIDLSACDEQSATEDLLAGIRSLDSGRRKPARPPIFPHAPAGSPRPFPGAVRPLPRRLVHAQITAQGLLDLRQTVNPYFELSDPTAAGDYVSAEQVSCYVWLPRCEYLGSANLQPLTPAACLCTARPERLHEALRSGLGPRAKLLNTPPRQLRKEEKEGLLEDLAKVLPGCFTVAITVPALLLGRRRPDFAYQSFADLFLSPVLEMHRDLGLEGLDLRIAGVGEKTGQVLRITKNLARTYFPKRGAARVEVATAGSDELVVNAGRLISWAVGAHYNSGDSRWLARLTAEASADTHGSSRLEEP